MIYLHNLSIRVHGHLSLKQSISFSVSQECIIFLTSINGLSTVADKPLRKTWIHINHLLGGNRKDIAKSFSVKNEVYKKRYHTHSDNIYRNVIRTIVPGLHESKILFETRIALLQTLAARSANSYQIYGLQLTSWNLRKQ